MSKTLAAQSIRWSTLCQISVVETKDATSASVMCCSTPSRFPWVLQYCLGRCMSMLQTPICSTKDFSSIAFGTVLHSMPCSRITAEPMSRGHVSARASVGQTHQPAGPPFPAKFTLTDGIKRLARTHNDAGCGNQGTDVVHQGMSRRYGCTDALRPDFTTPGPACPHNTSVRLLLIPNMQWSYGLPAAARTSPEDSMQRLDTCRDTCNLHTACIALPRSRARHGPAYLPSPTHPTAASATRLHEATAQSVSPSTPSRLNP